MQLPTTHTHSQVLLLSCWPCTVTAVQLASPASAQEAGTIWKDAIFVLHQAVHKESSDKHSSRAFLLPLLLFYSPFLMSHHFHVSNQRVSRAIHTDTASVTASSSAFPRWPQNIELTTLIRNPSSWATN